jgi:hypothetical protein
MEITEFASLTAIPRYTRRKAPTRAGPYMDVSLSASCFAPRYETDEAIRKG